METMITVKPKMLKGEVTLPKTKAGASLGWFFLAAGAIGSSIAVNNLDTEKSSKIIDIIKKAGGKTEAADNGITVRMTADMKGIDADISDEEELLLPVALLCAFLKGESRITGVKNSYNDLLKGIASEFKHLGIYTEMTSSGLLIQGGQTLRSDGAYAWNNTDLAIALILAASRAEGEVRILGFDENDPKFKAFMRLYNKLTKDK